MFVYFSLLKIKLKGNMNNIKIGCVYWAGLKEDKLQLGTSNWYILG
jgi:hypothetical protein